MSYYSYLVRKDNKTMYNLGKGSWYSDLDIFQIKNYKLELDNDYIGEEFLGKYLINEKNILSEVIQNYFKDLNDDSYIKFVIEAILNFCNNFECYLITDSFDLYHQLINDEGYQIVDSRYKFENHV